jgi:hypothetical protein
MLPVLASFKSVSACPDKLRRVSDRDPKTGRGRKFLTNKLHPSRADERTNLQAALAGRTVLREYPILAFQHTRHKKRILHYSYVTEHLSVLLL